MFANAARYLSPRLFQIACVLLLINLLHGVLIPGAPAQAAVVMGPVLGDVTPTSIRINWRDDPATAADGVLFEGKLYAGSVDGRYRSVRLTGLQPDTSYHYAIVHGESKAEYVLHTAPAEPMDFTFAVYGDCRSNPKIHRSVIEGVEKLQPKFVINTGDLVAGGNRDGDWRDFFKVAAPLTGNVPYFVAPGNHEQNSATFFQLFPGMKGNGAYDHEWYGFDYGNVHVVVLNSTRKVAEQRDWLAKDLAANAGKSRWTVVAFHYPPYSSSARNGDATIRKQWVPVLEKYHVDLVVLGHDHFYERSERNGVRYLIVGGGGAPEYDPNVTRNPYKQYSERAYHYLRVDVTGQEMHVRMFHLDGTVGDDITLTKPAATGP